MRGAIFLLGWLTGCLGVGSPVDEVREAAASDFDCTSVQAKLMTTTKGDDDLRVAYVIASGCGKTGLYRCREAIFDWNCSADCGLRAGCARSTPDESSAPPRRTLPTTSYRGR